MKLILTVVFLFLIQLDAFSQVEQIRDKLLYTDELLVVAHRAAHHSHPENSLQAIQEAIDMGVDIVEIDVRVTTDGIVYLMHDQSIDRTTIGSGDIEKLESTDLQSITLLFEGKDSGIAIPTLQEALALTKGKIMVDLDLKTDRVEEVIAVVNKMDVLDEVIFFDSDWQVLREIKAKLPDAFLMPRLYKTAQIRKANKKLTPVIVHIDPGFNTPKTMLEAKKYGLRIWINSLGSVDDELRVNPDSPLSHKLVENGASLVQTDLPKLWVRIKENRNAIGLKKGK
ncbi:glycerophosphodiester phosphodiesterase family protein [Algoriphagus sp. Y33]|uniref:glycerophosphodiester phosphodiesterase family protein n=1 Tax=Algoriphagus sp. Y33 TaxID=2772483 RepID=UPI001785CE8B|nr:glycerophosphodiester phosphodiesterase family protein [Algoriphagus sp. Y33]